MTNQKFSATILIVDDNQQNLHVLGSHLESKGYDVVASTNGNDALEFTKTEEVDLILLDIMMPEMDGYEVCSRLKENENTKDIPIIFLTAKKDIEDIVKGFKIGGVDFITKPFSQAELIARVNTHIELKFLRDRLVFENKKLYRNLEKLTHNMENSILQKNNNSKNDETINIEMINKINIVIKFIDNNYDCNLSREGLASAVNIHPDTLSRYFKKTSGLKLTDYINNKRIQESKILLIETDKAIITIAHEIGYENIRTFNRAFKEITGLIPKDFRKKIPSQINEKE